MASTTAASSSKQPETEKKAEQPTDERQPHLGVLEEDDEFEEFEVQGAQSSAIACTNPSSIQCIIDWEDSQTALAHLGGAAPGGAKSQGDKLWEDNWDDDDVEEEFSVQLRCARNPL
jgi:26 proteasome complex subunit DSS1